MMLTAAGPQVFVLCLVLTGTPHAATWTTWSSWSECSRTCDGGASYQLRECVDGSDCIGTSIQYQTCNNKPCPSGTRDFRSLQCAAYNDVPYNKQFYEWIPYHEHGDPCSLRCEAKGQGFRVMLAPKVLDGTRCNQHSADMCINGKCRSVGCDNTLESDKKWDRCGVCGGDGSSCHQRSPSSGYVWKRSGFSRCSVSCGVGYQVSQLVCQHSRSGKVVFSGYCDKEKRPSLRQRQCREHSCAPTWITSKWQICSKSCGGGISIRQVYCAHKNKKGVLRRTHDKQCAQPKPVKKIQCNPEICPKWYAGQWSPCSVTCGSGHQLRDVICRSARGRKCPRHNKPVTRKLCFTNVKCIGEKAEVHWNATAPVISESSAVQSGSGQPQSESEIDQNHLIHEENDSSSPSLGDPDDEILPVNTYHTRGNSANRSYTNFIERNGGPSKVDNSLNIVPTKSRNMSVLDFSVTKPQKMNSVKGIINVTSGSAVRRVTHREPKNGRTNAGSGGEAASRTGPSQPPRKTFPTPSVAPTDSQGSQHSTFTVRVEFQPTKLPTERSTRTFPTHKYITGGDIEMPSKRSTTPEWRTSTVPQFRLKGKDKTRGQTRTYMHKMNYQRIVVASTPAPTQFLRKQRTVKILTPPKLIHITATVIPEALHQRHHQDLSRPVPRPRIKTSSQHHTLKILKPPARLAVTGAASVSLHHTRHSNGRLPRIKLKPRPVYVSPRLQGDPGPFDSRRSNPNSIPHLIRERPMRLNNDKQAYSLSIKTSKEGNIAKRNPMNYNLQSENTKAHHSRRTSHSETIQESVVSPDGILEARDPLRQRFLPSDEAIPTEPSFVTSLWSPCSTTCGLGYRTREVKCKVYLEFAGTIEDLPDSSCPGPKPKDVEECKEKNCDLGHNVHSSQGKAVEPYAWEHFGFGSCSASCLGGIQKAVLKCLRHEDQKIVDEQLCASLPRAHTVRPCNDFPCPPRWNVRDYGPCSARCGGGHHRRRVKCVQELGRGEENIADLPDSVCPPPVPRREAVCNLIDCKPGWMTGSWSQCSSPCGTQHRTVWCQQTVSFGKLKNITDTSKCPKQIPESHRKCYAPQCPLVTTSVPTTTSKGFSVKVPQIRKEHSKYVQMKRRRKVTVVVGGTAVIIPKTTVLIRCPVKHFDQHLVVWKRKNKTVGRKGRIKVSRTGALRLRKSKLKDSGIYTCIVANQTASITIEFHSEADGERLLQTRRPYLRDLHRESHGTSEIRGPNREGSYTRDIGNKSSIPYRFVLNGWEPCSKTCGGPGTQQRRATCELLKQHYFRIYPDQRCLKLGLKKSVLKRTCGWEECPLWSTGNWSDCSHDVCTRPGVGVRKRPLRCLASNKTELLPEACDAETAPLNTAECPMKHCDAVWKASVWTKCSVSCGGRGVRTRMLRCVWSRNKRPAGIFCKGKARPISVKPCDTPHCSNIACEDKSKFCSLVPMLQLCKYEQYRRRCCNSCSKAS